MRCVGRHASLPEAEVAAHYARHAQAYGGLGLSRDKMERMLRATRRAGFSEMTDFRTEETSGVGCAFRLSSNSYAGISMAAINSRMPALRRRELGAQLVQDAQALAWTAESGPGAHGKGA